MVITGNTIKELKNLKDYCNNTLCEDCPFDDSAEGNSCLLKLCPFQYDIEKITQRFFDNAEMW